MRTLIAVVAALFVTLSGFPPHPAQADALAASQLEGLVNQARLSQGVAALRIDSRLQSAAASKISYMINSGCYLARCVNEPSAYERQAAAGYPSNGSAAELIDTRNGTATGVISTWMIEGSSSRFLLTLASFTDVGCAQQMVGSTPLWVCDFGQGASYAVTSDKTGRVKVR
jgi:hypothetical protein